MTRISGSWLNEGTGDRSAEFSAARTSNPFSMPSGRALFFGYVARQKLSGTHVRRLDAGFLYIYGLNRREAENVLDSSTVSETTRNATTASTAPSAPSWRPTTGYRPRSRTAAKAGNRLQIREREIRWGQGE
jgi:hypothetical protein